jgi:AraC-like DNA-binding protein
MPFIEIEKSVKENAWSMHALHSHPHYEIYFLCKGSRSFFLSNAFYKVEAPVVIVIPPHVMHKTEGGSFQRFNIDVSPDYLTSFQKDVLDRKSLQVLKPDAQTAAKMEELLSELCSIDRRQRYGDEVFRTLFSYAVFLLHSQKQKKLVPTATAKQVPSWVLKAIDYLNHNYPEKLTLEDLSEEFFVAKPTLLYNFKKYTNCSPIDFLVNVRLTKAKELLLNSKKSIGEIAELCGFSSSNYFGLIFKQKEGLSPANYRKYQQTKS